MRRRGIGCRPARGRLVATADRGLSDRLDRDVLEDGRRYRGLRQGLRILAAGVGGDRLAGLAVVLFVVSGPLRRRGVGRSEDKQATEPGPAAPRALSQDPAGRGQLATRPVATRRADTVPAASPAKPPAKGRKARNADDDDDDLGDVRISCAATASPESNFLCPGCWRDDLV